MSKQITLNNISFSPSNVVYILYTNDYINNGIPEVETTTIGKFVEDYLEEIQEECNCTLQEAFNMWLDGSGDGDSNRYFQTFVSGVLTALSLECE